MIPAAVTAAALCVSAGAAIAAAATAARALRFLRAAVPVSTGTDRTVRTGASRRSLCGQPAAVAVVAGFAVAAAAVAVSLR